MAFMLGSFTSGLFSGINEVQTAFARNEQAKQEHIKTQQMQMQMDAAKDAKAAMDGDAAKKALGNAAAPQAVSTGQSATQSTGGAGTGAPVKSEPLPDLKSVPQPNYLNGVTTRHNTKEQMNPGTDGVTAPAQPQQPQQPSGGSELIGVGPSQNEHDNTPQGPLPQGPMALTTDGIQHLQPGQSGMTFSWDRGLSPTGPYAPTGVAGQQPAAPQGAVANAAPPTSAPHYLPGQAVATGHTPAWGPRRALTPWGARPPVQQALPVTPSPSPVGQAAPMQPQPPGIATQQQPLGQQILSAVSPF